MKIDSGLLYSKNDEWVRIDGDTAVIGITDYAQSELSDIVFAEVSVEEGESVEAGDCIGTVESVKAASDTPCAIGFGISTPEQAAKMAQSADGVIVGSAIVKIIAQYGKDAPVHVGEFVKSMVDAIK